MSKHSIRVITTILILSLAQLPSGVSAIEQPVKSAVLQGDWEQVYKTLKKDTNSHNDPVAWFLLGFACTATNRNNESFDWFGPIETDTLVTDARFWQAWTDTLATENPDNAIAVTLAADGWFQVDQMDSAVAGFTRAIELDSCLALAYDSRGLCYVIFDQYEAAIADFSSAIICDSGYVEAWYNRGSVMHDYGDLYPAKLNLDRAIKLNSGYIDAYNTRGLIHHERGRFRNAIEDFSKAIKKDKDNELHYHNRALSYLENGQILKALRDLKKVTQLTPESPSAWLTHIQVSLRAGDYKGVMSDCERMLKDGVDSLNAYWYLAEARYRRGDYDAAFSGWTALLSSAETNKRRARILANLGRIYVRWEQYDKAIELLDSALTRDSVNADINIWKGNCYEYKEEWGRALEEYSIAVDKDSSNASAYDWRGMLYIRHIFDEAKGCEDLTRACDLGMCDNYRLARRAAICP